jgi:molecular chaperone GrpE
MDERTNGKAIPSEPVEPGQQGARAQERIDSLDTSPATLVREIEELRAELEEARRDAADAKAGWQRNAADFTNYRRRTEQERQDLLGLASDSLLLKVLALADDFDRALDHISDDSRDSPWVEGVVAIDRKLRQLLESEGVSPLEAQGHPFDPREHQAIAHEDSAEVPDGTVIGEVQRGYRVRDRVLRPALVVVARNDGTQQSEHTGAQAPDTRE